MFVIGVCIFGSLVAAVIYVVFKLIGRSPELPLALTNQYWGIGDYCPDVEHVIPFKIEFSKEMIADLISRLHHARFIDSYENIGFEYGFNHKTLKEFIQFWIEEYKFTEREKYLNKFPHYTTIIQGLNIHFIHAKPSLNNRNIKILPIVLLHGWPGSIREFYEMIPLLLESENGDKLAFEVIVPSLPGFGFSQGSSKVGLGPVQIAIVIGNLMKRLGYEKYYVQGGDWGSIIGSHMATLFPNNILGYHTNMAVINTPLSIFKQLLGSVFPSMYLEKRFHHRVFPLKDKIMTLIEETGYLHEQATKPDTIGAALDDSPTGLAAWIVEKFSPISGKNKIDGGLSMKYSYTSLIDNLMFYWVGKSATTSARIYAEAFSKSQRDLNMDSIPTRVPVAVARFPDELAFSTRWQLQEKYLNILQISDLPQGGHFAALEVPKILADDIRSAVLKFEYFHLKNI